MFDALTWLAIVITTIAHTLAAVCFKLSAQQTVRKRILGYFVLGNTVGFLCPLCVTIAMSGNNPNLVIAMLGVGGVFFHVFLNWFFRVGLTRRQWVAILIMIAGGILLKLGSPDGETEGAARTPQTGRSLVRQNVEQIDIAPRSGEWRIRF